MPHVRQETVKLLPKSTPTHFTHETIEVERFNNLTKTRLPLREVPRLPSCTAALGLFAGSCGTTGSPSLVALVDFVTAELSARRRLPPPVQSNPDAPGMQESDLGLAN